MDGFVMVHGGLGVIALGAGLVAAVAPKRRGLHVWAGRVFASILLGSLLVVAVPIVLRGNVFMLGLGTVAWFAVVEGWRALLRVRGTIAPGPGWVDYLAVALTTACATGLGVFGAVGVLTSGNPLYAVCIAFTALGWTLGWQAWRRWSMDLTAKQWLDVHIGHMSGALGAAVTAAAVVNLEGLVGGFEWVLWIAPTVVSTGWAQRVMRA